MEEKSKYGTEVGGAAEEMPAAVVEGPAMRVGAWGGKVFVQFTPAIGRLELTPDEARQLASRLRNEAELLAPRVGKKR